MESTKKRFMTAEWRKLAIANYDIDPILLQSYLPKNTELDIWNGKCYVSLIGFMFLNVKILGIKMPFHSNFEEVNLRFYVRYKENGIWKRGVTFIKEIVPKHAITLVANTLYNEKYETMKMNHLWEIDDDRLNINYQWKKGNWNNFSVIAKNKMLPILENSEEEFITEHYWGYTKANSENTDEYGVEHPRWQVYPVESHEINVDFSEIYGQKFGFLASQKPDSVMLAEGSEIIVRFGTKI